MNWTKSKYWIVWWYIFLVTLVRAFATCSSWHGSLFHFSYLVFYSWVTWAQFHSLPCYKLLDSLSVIHADHRKEIPSQTLSSAIDLTDSRRLSRTELYCHSVFPYTLCVKLFHFKHSQRWITRDTTISQPMYCHLLSQKGDPTKLKAKKPE